MSARVRYVSVIPSTSGTPAILLGVDRTGSKALARLLVNRVKWAYATGSEGPLVEVWAVMLPWWWRFMVEDYLDSWALDHWHKGTCVLDSLP